MRQIDFIHNFSPCLTSSATRGGHAVAWADWFDVNQFVVKRFVTADAAMSIVMVLPLKETKI